MCEKNHYENEVVDLISKSKSSVIILEKEIIKIQEDIEELKKSIGKNFEILMLKYKILNKKIDFKYEIIKKALE